MSTSRHCRQPVGRESDTDRIPAPSSGNPQTTSDRSTKIHRPEFHTEFLRERSAALSGKSDIGSQRLTKLLLNVTIQRSLGPVQVVTSPEKTVKELIKTALQIYVKEKRRPFLSETDPQCFQLHYSQFSLESLNPEEKLISLGSRNFFLCVKPTVTVKSSSCSNEANKKQQGGNKSYFVWTRFMDFLL